MTLHRRDLADSSNQALALGAIQVDPAQNLIRGGRCDPPSHPKVKEIIDSLQANGGRLLQCLGVRVLDQPIARPCGTGGPCCSSKTLEKDIERGEASHHTYALVYGYRRYVAVQACGWNALSLDEAEVKILDDCSDEDAEDANAVENLVRSDPTEYEVACAFIGVQTKRRWTPVQIAQRVGGGATPYFVEALIRIVSRVPQDVLDQWAKAPTKENRRALDRISKIDLSERWEKTHRDERMRAEWALVQSAEAPPATEGQEAAGGAPGSGGRPKGTTNRYPAAMRAPEVERLAVQVDQAREIYDTEGGWRPLTDGEKRAIYAVLGHVSDPRATRAPIR